MHGPLNVKYNFIFMFSFYTVHSNVITQYKPTKCIFSKLTFQLRCLLHISSPRFHLQEDGCKNSYGRVYLMFIGPCIIVIVDEWKTNLMSLAILFHLLCAQHVSDINISIFRGPRLC